MVDLQRKRTYQCWQDMKARCYNERNHNFKNYGGRGIEVCEYWRTSFEHFVADMGIKPEGMTLERINNDAGYQPDNCRWATRAEQRANQRTCRYIEFNGERKTLRAFAIEYGLSEATLSKRLDRGLSVEEALTTPISKRHSVSAQVGNTTRWSAAIASQSAKEPL